MIHLKAKMTTFIWLQIIFMTKGLLWSQKNKIQFWTFYNPLEQSAVVPPRARNQIFGQKLSRYANYQFYQNSIKPNFPTYTG